MRAPLPIMPVVMAFRLISQLRFAARRGLSWVIKEPLWWAAAIRGMPRCLRDRRRVSLDNYVHWLRLFRRPISYKTPSDRPL